MFSSALLFHCIASRRHMHRAGAGHKNCAILLTQGIHSHGTKEQTRVFVGLKLAKEDRGYERPATYGLIQVFALQIVIHVWQRWTEAEVAEETEYTSAHPILTIVLNMKFSAKQIAYSMAFGRVEAVITLIALLHDFYSIMPRLTAIHTRRNGRERMSSP